MKKLSKFFTSETLIIFLILFFAFILRVPFFNEPLDYDEGSYAFFAFFSKGESFYSSLPIGRLPGIIFTYRFLDDFFPGQIAVFRIVAALLGVLATFVIYKLGKLLYNRNVGLFSALIFALFSSQISQDSPANTEFFMIPFVIFSFWLFWLFQKSKRMLWLVLSGLCGGMAVFYKQVAVFEAGFLGLWLIGEHLKVKEIKLKPLFGQLIIFGIFLLVPTISVASYFAWRQEFTDFWWQSFGSGSSYVAYAWRGKEWFFRLKNTFQFLWLHLWPFWLAGLGGLTIILTKRQKENIFLGLWVIFALIGAFFNGWFFPHYFIQVVPVVSLLAGLFIVEALGIIQKRFKFISKFFPFIIMGIFLLMLKNQLPPLGNYLQMLRGKIDKIEYFKRIGLDTQDAGWLPFYEGANYLKSKMEKQDSLFVWSTTPFPYYLVRKYPTTSFNYYYYFLDYRFMLPTYRGWSFDFEANRQRLMEKLTPSPPTYILIHVNPEQIFDQMILFPDFGRFVSQNYNFEKKFGNILIFKKAGDEKIKIEPLPIIPLELIKYYSAITELKYKNGQTEVTFEPMVNPNGVLRTFKTIYSYILRVNFKPISIKVLEQDGNDFIGNSFLKPSGIIDFHLQIEGTKNPINFVRVKNKGVTYNNQSYGVNYALKLVEGKDKVDIYFEPPNKIKGEVFDLYLIYQNGDISKYQFLNN